MKSIEVKTRKNPIDKILKTIDEKKQEIKKVMELQKQKDNEKKQLEKKFQAMNSKCNLDSICKDSNFIEKIKRKDQEIGGERFLEKFEKINNKIDHLKMKGFRLIVEHEENKKRAKHQKKVELSRINESDDPTKQSNIIINSDILDK